MCGFAAIVSLSGASPDPGLIARMSMLLSHRGPDDDGLFTENGYAVAFRRLAILDLAPSGHQPMLSPDGRFVIVFNGEIYNYLELREELGALGHVFRSSGDTEVLLAAYQQWGDRCLERLNGMWAFLIYDRLERRVFGARDRFGVKPLYMFRDSRLLMFASEIKAIRDSGAVQLSPDWQTIAHFLLDDRLDDSRRTFYVDVEQFAAGSAFEANAEGSVRRWQYWSLPPPGEQVADPASVYRDLFDDAVRLRLRSDVAVGVQLSGGLDSTSIICRMAQHWADAGRAPDELQAFCYLSPEFDESDQIEATLRQTRASQVPLESSPADLWSSIEKHLWHQDEPVHSFTSVVGFKLMELARSRNVKVLLNGQGADESLAGYENYFFDYWPALVRAGKLRAVRRELDAFAMARGRSRREIELRLISKCTKQALAALPGYRDLALARRRSHLLGNTWVSGDVAGSWVVRPGEDARSLHGALCNSIEASPLPLYLRVEDRNAMAHGVEVRLPFLDYRLINLAFSLDDQWKLNGPYTKRLLREAMQGRIPEVVRTQVRKLGFPTSVDSWFRDGLYEPLRDMLSSNLVRESGLWNNATVTDALEQHRRGLINHGARHFDVAQMCLWMEGSRKWPQDAGLS